MVMGLTTIPACEKIVSITVNGDTLEMYPRRYGDVLVFYQADPNRCSPERPNQVRWVAAGLPENRRIEIRAKQPDTEFFGGPFVIPGGRDSVTSGRAQRPCPPSTPMGAEWNYSIHLMEGGRELYKIDPTILIKNDP